MATVREYFDTDVKSLTLHGEWAVGDATGATRYSVIAKIAQDFDGNARYWSFFIPNHGDHGCIPTILSLPETANPFYSA